MRRYAAAFVAVLFAVTGTFLAAPPSDGASEPSVWISEVDPVCEGITLTNVGGSPVDLEGWYVTDSEGTVSFTASRILPPGVSLTLVKERGGDWFSSRPGTIPFGQMGTVKTGNLVLANSGDDVSLYHRSTLVDSVCYGTSKGVDGWIGDPVPISSKQYLLRTGGDTDTSADWICTKPGRTNLSFPGTEVYEAEVTPFTFPESEGIPILQALDVADSGIDISIYLLTSKEAVAHLCQKLRDGVSVRILLEGRPLGVDISRELSMMKNLADLGAEVHLINMCQDHRFTYLHNKYAVIDGSRVVITSENWTNSNIGPDGNRGWGAVIDSRGYAEYMSRIFENDFSQEWGDVKTLSEAFPDLKPMPEIPLRGTGTYETQTYQCRVSPILSPDDSFTAMRGLMGSVSTTLYAEQLDLGSGLVSSEGDTPISWMAEAARTGADVRFVLDASQSTGPDHVSYVNLINSTTGIQAVAVDGKEGFSTIHNKGLIMDGNVWLGSVNWTSTSLEENRESAVLITSDEVTEYFSGFFMEDFGMSISDVEKKGLGLFVSMVDSSAGRKVVLTADGPEDCVYLWDLGNGTTRRTLYPETVFDSPGTGTFRASVAIEGTNVTSTAEYSVPDDGAEGTSFLIYGSAAIVLSVGTGASFLRDRSDDRRNRRGGGPPNAAGRRGRRL